MPALAHLGIGLATKRFAPQIPLWILLICSVALDLLTIVFFFALWPTHGLLMSVVWMILALVITMFVTTFLKSRKNNEKLTISGLLSRETLFTSMVIGLVLFSHWVLDFIGWPMTVIDPTLTGTPFLFDDSVNFGFGVYSTWVGALTMDIGMFAAGFAVYIHYIKKVKKPKQPTDAN